MERVERRWRAEMSQVGHGGTEQREEERSQERFDEDSPDQEDAEEKWLHETRRGLMAGCEQEQSALFLSVRSQRVLQSIALDICCLTFAC